MPLNLFYTMVQKSQKWPKTQIKGGSCLNFIKTLFDWERLDFAKYRIFSLWDPIFEVLFVKANKCGYSSLLLQSRILKNVLEPDLPPI